MLSSLSGFEHVTIQFVGRMSGNLGNYESRSGTIESTDEVGVLFRLDDGDQRYWIPWHSILYITVDEAAAAEAATRRADALTDFYKNQ